MSEELQAKNYIKKGQVIGDYEYLNIGATTLNQLLKAGFIPDKGYKEYGNRKPDRLFIQRGDKRNPIVVAVVEDKALGTFQNKNERLKAIQQCNDVCQEINSKIGIITDSRESIWINPQHNDKENDYFDTTTNKLRSYSFITLPSGIKLKKDFEINQIGDEQSFELLSQSTRDTYELVKEVVEKISDNNSILTEGKKIDPLPLARRVWQDIWIATGKSPEKCLYNVVELFIFKFLSDLDILQSPYDFNTLYRLFESNPTKSGSDSVLSYYTNNSRREIIKLFPHSESDHTTIINGTIFVDEKGDANLSTSILFANSLKKFKEFELEFGKFTNIDKDFKTKLYETFLKQTAGLKSLGQFFTPRKVIRAIIQISDVDKLTSGQRYCDPFCGVGGFVLEPLNIYKELFNDFVPKNGQIKPSINYFGYDKGFEKDEERTIILAKANMLIYLAEIISKHKNLTREFSKIFNNTFRLWKTNLATLGKIPESNDDLFDLIITNPPYVTKGKRTLMNEIEQDSGLKDFYSINAIGVEGLCLEWIIKNLRKNGRAFVIVPDGILNRRNDSKLRKFLLEECYLDAIISLPIKTFFSTPKKTYILAITKKDKTLTQNYPVFTYLVSNIGETLDVNRFEIEENDLKEMVSMFNQFKGIKGEADVKKILESQSKRCKIYDITQFNPDGNWKIDRWWSHDEKVDLKVEEMSEILSVGDFIKNIEQAKDSLQINIGELEKILTEDDGLISKINYKKVELKELIDFKVNTNTSKFTKSFVNENKGSIPVYSASKDPNEVGYGYVKDNMPDVRYFEDSMTWNIDGSIGDVFIRKGRFSLSEKVIPLVIFDKYKLLLSKKYLKYCIQESAKLKKFGFSDKPGKSQLMSLKVAIPINTLGEYDIKLQEYLANKYEVLEDNKAKIIDRLENVTNLQVGLNVLGDD